MSKNHVNLRKKCTQEEEILFKTMEEIKRRKKKLIFKINMTMKGSSFIFPLIGLLLFNSLPLLGTHY